jgi:phytanoyl-CoA hydroxylase
MQIHKDLNMNLMKADYDKNGWIMVPKVFTESEVLDVLERLKLFIATNKEKFLDREINYVDGVVNSLHCLHKYEDPFFKKIQENQEIKKFISYLLEDEAECRGGEAFLKPAQKGLPSPMHQDNYYWCVDEDRALTCWIALDDVDASNGGVNYYSGSHKLGVLAHEASYAPGSSQKIKPELLKNLGQPVCPTLKKGDMLIHHSLTVHGSSANTSGRSRRGMTIQYKGLHAGYDIEKKLNYEKSLQEQINSRKQS